jgi:YesN/AraC family two-component response regulator
MIAKFGHGINYYNKLIKNHTGLSYVAYLQNIKLEKAEQLLLNTRYSVEEIIFQVGYSNLTHFYNLFYKKFKTKPNDYRRNAE